MQDLHCSFLEGSMCVLHNREKLQAIRELIEKTSVFYSIKNKEQFIESVLQREHEYSTGFGRGVAVAHAQFEGIKSVIMGLGVSWEGINYGSVDGKPVHLLFLIASPPGFHDDYLQALSVLVKLLRQTNFRQEMLDCTSIKEMRSILHAQFCRQLEEEKKRTPRRVFD